MGRRLGILLSAREGKSCGEKTDVLQEGTAFRIASGPPVGTRLRRGLYGQTAGDFAFLPGSGNPVKAGGPCKEKERPVIWADRPLFS